MYSKKCSSLRLSCFMVPNKFDASKSSTNVAMARPWLHVDPTLGALRGSFSSDAIHFINSDRGENAVSVELAEVVKANNVNFATKGYDLVLGIGFVNATRIAHPSSTLLGSLSSAFNSESEESNLKLANTAAFNKIFAFDLREPSLTIGNIDQNAMQGNVTQVPIIAGAKSWSVQMDGISVNNAKIIPLRKATFASNVNSILLPVKDAARLNTAIGARRLGHTYLVHCSAATLNNVTLEINGIQFTLEPNDYVSSTPTFGWCKTLFEEKKYGPRNELILGTIFLKKFYTIFDGTANKIGFANYA